MSPATRQLSARSVKPQTWRLKSGNKPALLRAALAADRGFMRTDAGAPEYLAMVEAAVAAADPSDTWTYARLLALLSQSLVFTPQATRRSRRRE